MLQGSYLSHNRYMFVTKINFPRVDKYATNTYLVLETKIHEFSTATLDRAQLSVLSSDTFSPEEINYGANLTEVLRGGRNQGTWATG